MRVGWGVDAHRWGGPGPLILAGVVVSDDRGLEATSDGDVAVHALCDALLGGAALGDLGAYFPSTKECKGVASTLLLRRVVSSLAASGYGPAAVDVTIISQSVPIAPHREDMRAALASLLGIALDEVSVKATTTDMMGFVGRDEGIAAVAVATLRRAG